MNPSPTSPHKGEGLYRFTWLSRWMQGLAARLLPPRGGDGRQARGGLASFLLLFLLLAPLPALAVNPDEILPDPKLEQRARDLSAQLRCMVCQNQSIDDSNAELARDLRLLVRERIVDGDSDQQVIDYVVSRYGEFVLLKPRLSMHTLLLWGLPGVLFVIGLGVAFAYARGRSKPVPQKLSAEEEARLGKLLDE
ncbi:cytochrome c-type biogenesis protein [Ciceribacter sichuanensis]|uniref:cytochrome c-type biogenesis protein n=1 Tax=Ciceribacter sichuanensis TaxID=2949647 RepID=UPI003CC90FED